MCAGGYVNKQCERCGAQMVHVFHTARYCPDCRKAVDREYHRRKHRETRLRKEPDCARKKKSLCPRATASTT